MKIMTRCILIILSLCFCHSAIADIDSVIDHPKSKEQSIVVADRFAASGWMGDGVHGTEFVNLNEACQENPKIGPTCLKISYTLGPEGWAGIYWLNKPNNWGDEPGEDLSKLAYTKISFWARGEQGGEIVEFKAGGVNDKEKKYRDSFEVTTGKLRLEDDWEQYEIDLQGKNLSSVIGFFCWVVAGTANPNGCAFYLDDIQFK